MVHNHIRPQQGGPKKLFDLPSSKTLLPLLLLDKAQLSVADARCTVGVEGGVT